MSMEEKKAAEEMLNAFLALPTEDRKYILGYSEGVAAAKKRAAQQAGDQERKDD